MVYEGRRSGSSRVYYGRGKGKHGKKRRAGRFFTACLWIVFVVVAASLAWPDAAAKVRAKAASLIGSPDLGGAVEVFGQSLGRGSVADAFKDAWAYAFEPEDGGEIPASDELTTGDTPTVGEEGAALPAMEDAADIPAGGPAGDTTGAPADDGVETLKAEGTGDPVEEFKASQAPYESLGIPNNVSFEKPGIGIELIAPVEGTVTSGFGYREHPSDGETRFHYGVDIGAAEGSQVRAAASGQVTAVGDSTSYGLYVILRHQDGTESLYAHLSEISVTGGETVEAGDAIGAVGSTGNATGACLHLELIVDGSYVNPGYYLSL